MVVALNTHLNSWRPKLWTEQTSCGNESLKCGWRLIPYIRGRGLDLGCGTAKVLPHAIGVDLHPSADVVQDIQDLSMFGDESMDFVFSSHALEDLPDTKSVLKEWWRVLKNGGYLVLYLPHKDYYPNVGTKYANPAHLHDFVPTDIINHMNEFATFDLIRSDEHNEGDEYSLF